MINQNKSKIKVVWFTGLSGAGKTTLALLLKQKLDELGTRSIVLDGDDFRDGLSRDLGFSDSDRSENIRRAGEVARLLSNNELLVLAAFISPFKKDRARVRSMFSAGEFLEVFCNTSVQVCEARDVKQLYNLARNGILSNFTGISSDYEPPVNPEIVIDTSSFSLNESVEFILKVLNER